MFETFSFLPPLSDAEMAKQVQYLLNNGWTPCIEFEDSEHALRALISRTARVFSAWLEFLLWVGKYPNSIMASTSC